MKKVQAHASDNGPLAILTFDKDDDDTLEFVAASANLRSIVFGIEPRSKFDIKRKNCTSYGTILLIQCRDGWQHHTCYRHHKRYDSWSLRSTGF